MSVGSFLDRFLPPPSWLSPASMGIDISESSVKYVSFGRGRSNLAALSPRHWGEITLKADTVYRGEIKDPTALSAALIEIKKRTNMSHVVLSLPEERVYLFETEIPENTDIKDIRALLEFRLEENVPLSPKDAYFDYRLYRLGDAGPLMASVAACPKSVADAYYAVCAAAKLTPLSFEVESQAIARAVLPLQDQSTKMLLDFGKTRTGLGIVHHGILSYTSTIEMGGDELSSGLRRQFGEQPEDTLTRLKNDQGLIRGNTTPAANEVLLPMVSVLKDEIQSHVRYWNDKHSSSRPIEEVVLCGGTANLRGLPEYLQESLKIKTSLADVWQNAMDSKLKTPPIDRRHSYGYATAIGLALSSFIK